MSFGGDDQERLLDEATAVVKEQAFYLKRAIDSDNTRDALKHSSNMICELRTSLLSPKNYYELYMQVFQEMQHLYAYFCDKSRHGRKMIDLYESVQHAGNILPRLYLLATVGAAYIKSNEAPAKEILKDAGELSKGVQHPLRGLFLRFYLSQMMKDKLPDTGSGYEGEGGDINDAFDFVFSNFNESNRLWVRIQHQGPTKDKQKREKERHDLRVLVGANLVRLSQLEGMTLSFYSTVALPKILEHICLVKDTMSQQYLFESMIQVFPAEYHIATLEQLLQAYAKAQPTVDMKPIVCTLMKDLAAYLQDPSTSKDIDGQDIFELFRRHLADIMARSAEQKGEGKGNPLNDIGPGLEMQASFMSFTTSLYPGQVNYVDLILMSTADMIRKVIAGSSDRLPPAAAEKIVDLLGAPLKSLSLAVLEMEHYAALLEFLDYHTRKAVALNMVKVVVEDNHALPNADAVSALFKFISPLLKDEADTPANEATVAKDQFQHEQQKVAMLPHQIRGEDTDSDFAMITAMRGFFGQGGPQRLALTLPATFYAALGLVSRIRAADEAREEGAPAPMVTVKKVFQFLHRTVTALQSVNPDVSLQLWLVAAACVDQVALASPAGFEPICFEFLTQALMCFEEEITETNKQYHGVFAFVGTLTKITCLEAENFDTLSAKVTQHAARLLKKPLQIRAIAACSHLFWCDARREGKRVLECLQKCLKTVDAVVSADAKQVGLWVEMLDKYCYFFETLCEDVKINFIGSLKDLCDEHVSFAEKDSAASEEGKAARTHLRESLKQLKAHKDSSDPEVAARYAELEL